MELACRRVTPLLFASTKIVTVMFNLIGSKRRWRKLEPQLTCTESQQTSNSEDENDASSCSDAATTALSKENLKSFRRIASPPRKSRQERAPTPSTREMPSAQIDITPSKPYLPAKSAPTPKDTTENELIRLTNAYPGTTNTLSSIHQRRWFLSIDRHNSGFVPLY